MKVAIAEHSEGPLIIKVFVLTDQSFSVDPYRDQISQIRKRISKHPNCCPFTRVYLTSRPFLWDVEKRWIIFQLLKALAQCRIAMVFHGDIKSENILISSSLWAQLTDFASFKPAFLPYDNPSNFTFFFDTSRRRTCNLAPERFKKSEELISSRLPGDFLNISEGLTEAMDIFGMAIDYKKMDERLAKQHLKKILTNIPEGYRGLLEVMLERDPVKRKEEFGKMSPCSSNLFPPIFERHLYRYFKEFQHTMGADDLITKLYVERDNYLSQLEDDKDESVLLLIDLVTSNLRACRSLSSKMDAISLLQQFSKLLPSAIADRIVPYVAHLLTDYYPQVRSESVFALTEILSSLSVIPPDECRLLVDFIFPKLLEENERILIKSEQIALQDTVNELFVNLCGSENDVRQCLFATENLERLCEFFGPNQATDILMHMSTLLNDKADWRIRATFFEGCPVVARNLGKNRCSKLKPFLQQGLQDLKEFWCCRLCVAFTLSVTKSCCPNPSFNKWLRVAAVSILVVLDTTFTTSDFYCKLTPLVKVYLTENLIRLNDKTVIYNCLVEPIPRDIWNFVVCHNLRPIYPVGSRSKSNSQSSTDMSTSKEPALNSAIRKLLNLGLTEEIEDKLLTFKNILTKMDTYRKKFSCKCDKLTSIHFNELSKVKRKIFDLDKGVHKMGTSQHAGWKDVLNSSDVDRTNNEYGSPSEALEVHGRTTAAVSEVYNDLQAYGSSSAQFQLEETLSHKRKRYNEQKRITGSNSTQIQNNEIAVKIAAAAGAYVDGGEIASRGNLVEHINMSPDTKKNRLELRLLSHLHEHSGKITRLALHPNKNHFASSSVDQSVKIWLANSASCSQESSHPSALSLDTFRYSHKINCCSFLGDGHLAIALADGDLQIFDIEHKRILKSYQIDCEQDGAIVDMHCFDHLIYALTHHSAIYCFDLRIAPKNSRNLIQLEPLWKKRARNSYGLMTSMCVDSANQHWMMLTASSATTKNLILCDLRFAGLEISSWSHPSDKIIPLRSWPLARASKCAEVITNSSREGELSLWDLSSQSRTDVFWPSAEAPLVYRQEFVTTALAQSCVDNNTLFTGDCEGSLRCWNLKRADKSNYLCGPYRKHLSDNCSPSASVNLQPFYFLLAPETPKILARNSYLKICGSYFLLIDLKSSSPRIRYNQIMFRDNLLRIQTEDRSQVGSLTERDSQKVLQVGEYHSDAITDLLSVWPDMLKSDLFSALPKMEVFNLTFAVIFMTTLSFNVATASHACDMETDCSVYNTYSNDFISFCFCDSSTHTCKYETPNSSPSAPELAECN
uniref:non-specific serine/threonine protein kinase n=1 Tax=Ditylenchus dipsaci TaxID=166011 RepID=A0A915EWN8_9BILA